ncbi:MAG: dihydrodipicolinate synthase family protein [Clostridiales bacterium]|nr:dihydrodipicolinate synthase family protein [Clostridiales bacterium]
MIKQIPCGVYPTMITPFTDDNKIDYDGVLAVLEWYKGKVDGIFAICQSSEIFFLSFEERLELLKFIMAHKPEGMAVVASGHTADDLDTQIKEAKAFIETGIDAYVFISNRFADKDESDDVLWANMKHVMDALPGIGFGVYECPYPYKRELTPYVLKKMAQSGRFKFLKDTCCDLGKIKDKLAAVEGSDLQIFNANSATLLESLKLGCAGFSGVMGNFHPELYYELCKIYKTQPERAQQLQDIVGFFSVAECQCYPVNAKYYMGLDGVPIGIHTRSRNPAEFTQNRKMEIEQMYRLTKRIEKM